MGSAADQFDPEIRAVLAAGPERAVALELIGPDMTASREAWKSQLDAWRSVLTPFNGTEEKRLIPGLPGNPDVPVHIYREDGVEFPEAVLVWVHGGGYVLGTAEDPMVRRYTPMMTVVSVDYRMAPEHRSPAAANDTCAVIEWVAANAAELGIDPKRIILGGPSGGGGVAAGAALLNRDRGGPELLYQLLIYPMIDDTHDTPSGHLDLPPYVWTREISLRAWSLYVEEEGATPYAAAARAEDVSGLPPAYVMTGDLDLFRDECINYASRMMAAGIPVDLAVFPGAPHGFDLQAPDTTIAKRAIAHMLETLHHVLMR
ncbi:MAG: alpha/beta hydrolase [Proteobacteria bacterium]|nr:alpha/beta hydrolase [Pseudomonadota bacterium]